MEPASSRPRQPRAASPSAPGAPLLGQQPWGKGSLSVKVTDLHFNWGGEKKSNGFGSLRRSRGTVPRCDQHLGEPLFLSPAERMVQGRGLRRCGSGGGVQELPLAPQAPSLPPPEGACPGAASGSGGSFSCWSGGGNRGLSPPGRMGPSCACLCGPQLGAVAGSRPCQRRAQAPRARRLAGSGTGRALAPRCPPAEVRVHRPAPPALLCSDSKTKRSPAHKPLLLPPRLW